jgi:hypothetical protein
MAMSLLSRWLCLVSLALAAPATSWAGGAWVPNPGDGDISFGFSDKTASSSWDTHGNAYTNRNGLGEISYHDFRYFYLDGEVGLFKNFSATFLMTYLDGIEGPHNNGEENSGPSDAWFGCKYALTQGNLPMALAFTYRTPIFYALPGPYTRELYDSQGRHIGESPSWRGLRLALSVLVPFGRHGEYFVEAGYGQWVWGISARRYREPFVSIDRRF